MKKLFLTVAILTMIIIQCFTLNVKAYEIDYTNDNLALLSAFSVQYKSASESYIDNRVSLYSTVNGKKFNYLGESGITGRDPRMIYYNGVFYLATTKGGSTKGGYTFNIFKSKDLLTWTDNWKTDWSTNTSLPYDYRYEVSTAINNKYGLSTNTWGPKWTMINNKVYLMVNTSRFDEDGSKYILINSNILKDSSQINQLKIEDYTSSIGVNVVSSGNIPGYVFKESAVLNSNGRAQYIDSNKEVILTRDKNGNIYNSNNKKLTKSNMDDGIYIDNENNCTLDLRRTNNYKCDGQNWTKLELSIKRVPVTVTIKGEKKYLQVGYPNGFGNIYPIFDSYISEVDFGTNSSQKDLDNKNLTFKGFEKILFSGWNTGNVSDTDSREYLTHSFLQGLLSQNLNYSNNNGEYKYAIIGKIDPFGTIQRWVSNSIAGPYKQIDDWLYKKSDSPPSTMTTCSSTYTLSQRSTDLNGHKPYRLDNGIISVTSTSTNDDIAYQGHWEGSFILDFNNTILFYSDHYAAKSHYSSNPTVGEISNLLGLYYARITNVTKDNYNLALHTDHLQYTSFYKLGVENIELRPSSMVNTVVRNGGIYRPTDSNEIKNFKSKLSNYSNFISTHYNYNTKDSNKIISIVKSNRAIDLTTSSNAYKNGWRYIDELINDSKILTLNKSLQTKYNAFIEKGNSLPFSFDEIYIYKIIDTSTMNNIETVKINDKYGNEHSEEIIRKEKTLTYNSNGGSICSPTTKKELYGKSWGILCTPTKDGYTFKGWNTKVDGSGTNITSSSLATNDITIYAQWNKSSNSNTQIVSDGVYKIGSANNSNYVLDIAGGSKSSGANLQLYKSNNSNAQRFIITYKGNGYYEIQNVLSIKNLTVKNNGTTTGTNVWQYNYNGNDSQLWFIEKTTDGYYKFHPKTNPSNLSLNMTYTNSNGANINIKTNNNTINQKFILSKDGFIMGTKVISNGRYTIMASKKTSQVLDIKGGSKANKANAQLYKSNNTLAQRFNIRYRGDGYYLITNSKSGKVLDVKGASTANKANVWQYTYNGTCAQLWIIKKNSNGTYTFINRCGRKALDIAGGKTKNKTNVQIYTSNNTAAQQFKLSAN